MPTATSLLIAAGIATAAAGGMQAYGAHQQGKAASRAASMQADMQRQKGKQEFALAQQRAQEERSRGDSLQSDAIAQSAAFGAGTMEKATIDTLLDIEGKSEYNALSQLYEGKSKQQDLNYGAELTTFKGRSARRAGNMRSFATILDTTSTLASMGANFGGGK